MCVWCVWCVVCVVCVCSKCGVYMCMHGGCVHACVEMFVEYTAVQLSCPTLWIAPATETHQLLKLATLKKILQFACN